MSKFTITDPESLAKAINWIKGSRGIRLWTNLEIGSSRRDMITPGDSGKPHWAMGNGGLIEPSQIDVEHRNYLAIPDEWKSKCERCNGTGKRSVADLAAIRREMISETIAAFDSGAISWGKRDGMEFDCNYCSATGFAAFKRPTCRCTRTWFGGFELSKSGERRFEEFANRLHLHYKEDVEYDWDWHDNRTVMVKCYTVQKETLQDTLNNLKEASDANDRKDS